MPPTPTQSQPPPRGRGGAAGRWAAVITLVVIVAAILLLPLLRLDRKDDRPAVEQDSEVVDLIPAPLVVDGDQPMVFDPRSEVAMPALEAGGWIQGLDEEGNLAQQYRFARLDPNPPGMPANWVRMDQPRAEIYLAENRVLTLAGDTALAHVPQRVLESGTLTGNVTIRLYQPPQGSLLDTDRDVPLMEVNTGEATFDNVVGEIRCEQAFHVETASLELPGRGLMVLVNDQARQPELTVEVQHVDFVRLIRSEATSAQEPEPPPDDSQPPPQTPGSDPRDVTFYKLTLHDDIRIQAGPESTGQTITGAELDIVFSSHSTTTTMGPGLARRAAAPAPSLAARLTLACLAQTAVTGVEPRRLLAPPPGDQDVVITCDGGLTIVPITGEAGAELLSSPQDALLRVSGRPVRMYDGSQDARSECDHLLYHVLEQKVELVGSPDHPMHVAAPLLEVGGDAFWIRRDVGGLVGRGWLESYGEPDDAAPDRQPRRRLRLTWSEHVDLEFADAPAAIGAGALSHADFHGNVLARGETEVITCDRLELDFDDDQSGRSKPTSITASGNVRAADSDQTVFADRVLVTLKEQSGAESQDGFGGEVDTVTATGDVQIRMARGARVYADTLLGDAQGRTVELTGKEVAVVHDQWLLDGGTRVILSKATSSARWFGPGRARAFNDQILRDADARIARPLMHESPRVTADWSRSLVFDDAANDGAGTLDLDGAVVLLSRPDLDRTDTLSADTVTIGLAPGVSSADQRTLGAVTARGEVKLESRTWERIDHGDQPAIFYVAGPRIDYDHATGSAAVPGAGELLIRDLRTGDGGGEPAVMSARGTTSFRWKDRLTMTRGRGTAYDIEMDQGVEMRHLGIDGSPSTLVCRILAISIDRPDAAAGLPAADPAAAFPGASGRAELQRITAEGGVFLRTPQRDVECGAFDYDLVTGLATLTAPEGGMATIYTHGGPEPIRMKRAEWDMNRDTLRSIQGTGGATR